MRSQRKTKNWEVAPGFGLMGVLPAAGGFAVRPPGLPVGTWDPVGLGKDQNR